MLICVRLFFLFTVTVSFASAQNPFQKDPTAVDGGRGAFRIYCSPCHGIKAEGGRGPDLTRGVYAVGSRDEDLHRVILDGVAATEMPGFRESLGEENAWRVVSYIRSVARREGEAVSGNAINGEKVYWGKGACGQCHRVGKRGGALGPDLTLVGRMRSLRYLRESVVAPNAHITPGFATIRVVTKDGTVITGVQRGLDNFSAQLMDSREKFWSFLKSDVQEIKRSPISPMPDTYGKLLSATELDDLVAYLFAQGRGETKP